MIRPPATMSGGKEDLDRKHVYYIKTTNDTPHIHLSIKGIMEPVKTLVDSGSSRNFIDIMFARRKNIPLTELRFPRTVIAIDGKETTEKVRFRTTLEYEIEGKSFKSRFYAMPLGDTFTILGKEWLAENNPDISWTDMSVRWRDGIPEEFGRIAKFLDLDSDTDDPLEGRKGVEKPRIPPEFEDFADVFDAEKFKALPPHRKHDCAINFKEEAELPRPAKAYPMSPDQQKSLKDFIDQELKDGKIRPSKSPIAAPCFYVKKADGSLRLVTDYRKINDITISDKFPIPLQEDLLEKLREAKIFTKLDLRWGYNNVRIKEGDEWKTAFKTKDGLYEYIVMPFGLKNAPAVFQRFMNELFSNLQDIYVVVYLDDILIYSKNPEEHTEHIREVLKRLRENHLFARPEKCYFFVTTVTYVGIVITPEGISMEPAKIKDVAEWPEPKTVKQVQAFLGFANFYRRFVPGFSSLAKPLTSLTRKESTWEWKKDQQEAFDNIKKAITSDPVLIHPDPDKPYYLETDASGVAMGAILSQRHTDGKLHPIGYMSKGFNEAQAKYNTYNKELLAIVEALDFWRLLLEGSEKPITIYTDHRNLQYWQEAHVMDRKHHRWYGDLASYNFTINYRPGKQSEKPDALSRRSDHQEIPTAEEVMIAAERFVGFKAQLGVDLIEQLKEAQQEDESLETLIHSVRRKEELLASVKKQYKRYEWKEDLLWYDGTIVVPDDPEIRKRILNIHHDSPIAGHQGRARTLELITRRYFWPNLKAQVNSYVDQCTTCAQAKSILNTTTPKDIELPKGPWKQINYDFIVKLPPSEGYDSILVIVDRFSRQAHFVPCNEAIDAEGVAEIFLREVWKHHGIPEVAISDRGPTFNSNFLRTLYQRLGEEPRFSTAYHLQTDGLAERTNQWLETYLRMFCNYSQDDWVKWLPIAEFCHNNQVNSATGQTAFQTIYRRNPNWQISDSPGNSPEGNKMAEHMKEIWDEAGATMERLQRNKGTAKEEIRYKKGDKVWLNTKNIRTRRPAKKLDDRNAGPFVISQVISSHAYRLKLPKTMRIHNVFHADLLSPFKEDTFGRIQSRPPPIITEEGEEQYEVERIVGWKKEKNQLYYKVKWQGYSSLENTMERAEKIAELDQVMRDFLQKHPKAPVPKTYKKEKG